MSNLALNALQKGSTPNSDNILCIRRYFVKRATRACIFPIYVVTGEFLGQRSAPVEYGKGTKKVTRGINRVRGVYQRPDLKTFFSAATKTAFAVDSSPMRGIAERAPVGETHCAPALNTRQTRGGSPRLAHPPLFGGADKGIPLRGDEPYHDQVGLPDRA